MRPFEAFRERLGAATDCFVFCHGWLNDQTEARDGALRFFAHLDTALQPLRDRVVPLRLAIHWPSRPFADPTPARLAGQLEAMPAPLPDRFHRAGSACCAPVLPVPARR